jgi:phosphatidylinositol alpha-1,6-mannosyltransferase
MPESKKVLFLTLRVFSITGGIEKVCRVFSKSLEDTRQLHDRFSYRVLSLYDQPEDVDNKYLPKKYFIGFGQSKWRFFFSVIRESFGCDYIVLSHINLLPVASIVHRFNKKSRIVLLAHGIELWSPLSVRRLRMLQKCAQILAVSRYTADVIRNQHQLSEEQVTVFPNCIDPFLTRSRKEKNAELLDRYGIKKNQFVLLTLTRLSSKEFYKGYDFVIRNLNHIAAIHPECIYLIIGQYDSVEKERLDELIKEHGLDSRVVFTGFIPDDQLEAHYRLGDLFIMPSKKEGFGIVFVEAMYFGLPVIAGNKDGSVEALLDGKMGILVDPDNDQELRDAVMKVIDARQQYLPDDQLLMDHFGYARYKKRVEHLFYSDYYP